MFFHHQSRSGIQITVLGLLFLTTIIAILVHAYSLRQKVLVARNRLASLQQLNRELVVSDAKKIIVLSRQNELLSTSNFAVHLPGPPDGPSEYRLCVAIEGIRPNRSDFEVDSKIELQEVLKPGRHEIVCAYTPPDITDKPESKHVFDIAIDNHSAFIITRPAAWQTNENLPAYSFSSSQQSFKFDRPIDLMRRRFAINRLTGDVWATVDRPANGLHVWIEPID